MHRLSETAVLIGGCSVLEGLGRPCPADRRGLHRLRRSFCKGGSLLGTFPDCPLLEIVVEAPGTLATKPRMPQQLFRRWPGAASNNGKLPRTWRPHDQHSTVRPARDADV
jgi:hypothetical protein